MVALRDMPRLGDDLDRLARALDGLNLGPNLSDVGSERDRLVSGIRNYLIPRAVDPDQPLTVVFAGPTGSGKSTLINSLTGVELSSAGPLRPTTTTPVVLASEAWGDRYETIADIQCELVVGASPVLDSMILVDTPDIDSTSTEHRAVSETLIDNADVVVFVTSALRYADSVPWQVLRRARSRGIDVIEVLNRVESSTRGALVDFKSRLADAGLDEEVVTVPEHHIAPGSQRIPSLAVRTLRRRLATLAVNRSSAADSAFDRVLRSTMRQIGLLDEMLSEVSEKLDSLDAEVRLELSGRVGELDLTGVGKDLLPPFPHDGSPRQLRRWKRSARRVTLTKREVDDVVVTIERELSRDIRRWLASAAGQSIPTEVDPRRLLTVIMPVVRLAMEGWIDFVRRIARDGGRRKAGPIEAVLVVSAVGDVDSPAARLVLGEEELDAVDRARRELIGRLEVVYQQVSALVVDLVREGTGDLDRTELRDALGTVSSALAPVDA